MKRKRSSLITSQETVSTYLYLDDYCWEHIFKFIFNNHDDDDENSCYFKTLSIVNKQFHSITNRLRLSLTVLNPTPRSLLSRLFQRFTNLISLDLSSYHGVINNLLVRISHHPFKLTSLNISNQHNIPAHGLRAFSRNITTLTSLICTNIASLSVADLLLISNCFPLLQQLDLSNTNNYCINVKLNGSMSMVFPNMHKLNLSQHINPYMDDAWLLHFCKTSEFLEELVLLWCPFFTEDGIASAIRERPTLKSLSIRWSSNITSHLIDSLISLKDLTCLHLFSVSISDELLSSIATRGLPLKKLILQYCTGYSYVGLFCLLSKCQSIQHLDLTSADFLNDQDVMKLSLFLGHLVSINLSSCCMLTELSLFSLVSKCLSLDEIKMSDTSIGYARDDVLNYNSLEDFVVSPQLKSLHLCGNSRLRDESIGMFASIFPNLQLLDLRLCHNIYGQGICQVLRRCCKIRHLNLAKCVQLKLHGLNFEVPNLKVMNLSHTSLDNETLYVISKSCSGLLQLFLVGCHRVTKKGIMRAVKNCTQLREINGKSY